MSAQALHGSIHPFDKSQPLKLEGPSAQVLPQLALQQGVENPEGGTVCMAIEWQEASRKFKIVWFCGLIGAPVLSVIIWRLQIPYVEVYLIIVAIVAWTAAILYKKRRRIADETTVEEKEENAQGGQ
jgi:hypothetical protein